MSSFYQVQHMLSALLSDRPQLKVAISNVRKDCFLGNPLMY